MSPAPVFYVDARARRAGLDSARQLFGEGVGTADDVAGEGLLGLGVAHAAEAGAVGLGRARGCPESPPRGGERFGRRGESRASAPPWSAARSCAPLERGSRRPRGSEPRDARGRRTSVLAHDLKSPPPTDTGWDGSRNAPPSSRARTTSRRTPRRAAGPPWSGRGGSDDGASCGTGWLLGCF